MPVKRGKNFRSGDLVEQLGVYLIQSLALVAPVPRTEDIGIDLVSTLIRDDKRYSYIAEDSFYIQIKSSSISMIEYDDLGVKWLYDLKLPLFIASVDRNNSSIKLFTTKRLYEAFALSKDRKKINLHLAEEEKVKIYDFVDKKVDDIFIGPAIIEWSVNDLMIDEDNVRNKFYGLLKEHIRIIHESMESQKIGCGSTYLWSTNEPPTFFGWKLSTVSNINLDEVSRITMNYLYKALDLSSREGNRLLFNEVQEALMHFESVYDMYEQVRKGSYKKDDDKEF